ncbi:hydroxylysine kinase-like [Mercenaria mercenaria]|uniref:hydroxylysine kinase-like n=1 Tax=Mercenaria mercenaria TaxID=6596 RepID=UPI00234F8E48|nr:hydroxylysine kinase-like [Mercenaria mercenaria]
MERVLLTEADVVKLVQRLYGLQTTKQTILASYDDVNIRVIVNGTSRNRHIKEVSEDGYVLKVLNTVDSKKVEFVGAMHAAIEKVSRAGIVTSHPVPNIHGQFHSTECLQSRSGKEGCMFLVRLFQFVPGDLLEGKTYTSQLCFEAGQLAGQLSNVLKDFEHPGLVNHSRHWNLREVVNLGDKIDSIVDLEDRKLVREVVEQFKQNVVGNANNLLKGTVHADLNEGNIIVKGSEVSTEGEKSMEFHVHGVLDFGDLVHEYIVYEIAIVTAYMMIESTILDSIDVAGHTLAGYIKELQLPAADCNVLKECICARLAQSFTYGSHEHKLDPTNTYCLRTSEKGWPVLRRLWKIPKHELYAKWAEILHGYSLTANFENC